MNRLVLAFGLPFVRRLAGGVTLVTLALPAGLEAAGHGPAFELRARSAHFLFFSAQGAAAPDVRRSERFLAKVERELGHWIAGRSKYYIVKHPVDVFEETGLYANGATSPADGWILSVHGYDPHELVHRVAGDLGNPGLFFHEGLAVALGERGRLGGRDVDDLAREALREHSFEHYLARFRASRSQAGYAVAGSFVGYLLQGYSPARLARFFRACGQSGKPSRKAFSRIFGVSFEEAVVDWRRTIS